MVACVVCAAMLNICCVQAAEALVVQGYVRALLHNSVLGSLLV